MAEPDLSKVHDLLVSVAENAGRMITTANPATVDTKKNCKHLYLACAGIACLKY